MVQRTILHKRPNANLVYKQIGAATNNELTALHFGVKAKENQDKVPTLYWLPKLHKKPYKARFIANSSSCTTTELSKLLTSCLTAVKNMLSNIVKKYMRDPVKTYFGRLKIQVKF